MKTGFKIALLILVAGFVYSCKPNPYRQYKLSKRERRKIHGQKVKPSKEVLKIEAEKVEQKEMDKQRLEHNLKVQNAKNKKKYIRKQRIENEPFSHH